MTKNEISDIRNDKIRELSRQDSLSEDKLNEFGEKLLTSIMITGYVGVDDGTNFVLIGEMVIYHIYLYSQILMSLKRFLIIRMRIYPQNINLNIANENIVINSASESIILNPVIFKN